VDYNVLLKSKKETLFNPNKFGAEAEMHLIRQNS